MDSPHTFILDTSPQRMWVRTPDCTLLICNHCGFMVQGYPEQGVLVE